MIIELLTCSVLFSVSLPGTQSDQNQSGARTATLQQQAAEARKGAEQGNAKDQALLASYYLWGTGVQKDEPQAFKWYLKAAEQGELGAQAQLATMYEYGMGVLQDYAEAVRWEKRAAEQGLKTCQRNLADMYFDGKGVPQDYGEAIHWYREAAEQGDQRAQFNLGTMYRDGKGVPQNYVDAHMWMNLAASRMSGASGLLSGGDEFRQTIIDSRNRLEAKMNSDQIAEAQRLAREWKPRDTRDNKSPANK